MQTRFLQKFLGALTCAFFLALGVTDSSAQGASQVSPNQKSARIAALRAQQNTPAAMPKPRRLAIFSDLKPANGAQPRVIAKTNNVSAQPYLAGLANFPGFSPTPYIAATAPQDGNPLFVALSGHFRNQNSLDVATLQQDGTLNLLASDGKGNFTLASSNSSYSSAPASGITSILTAGVGDLNGDGIDDIVAVDEFGNNLLVFLSNGDGTFGNVTLTPVSSTAGASFNPLFGSGGGGIAVADVNHDGKPDVVTVQIAGGFPSVIAEQTFLNDGHGNLTPSPEVDTSVPDFLQYNFFVPGQFVLMSDVNGDGNPDTLLEYFDTDTSQMVISVALGSANGTFGPMQTAASAFSFNAGSGGEGPAFQVADMNGDGHPDLVYLPGDGTAQLALGVGDGTFGAPSTVLSNTLPLQQFAQMLQVGDFNNDGIPDLLISNPGSMAVYPGNGTGGFSATPDAQFAINSFNGGLAFSPQEPAPADFDGDGNLDVPVADGAYGAFLLVHGLGNGRFTAPRAVAPNNISAVSPSNTDLAGNIVVLAAGDVNSDGLADVLTLDYTNANQTGAPDIDFGLSNGKGGFSFSTAIPAAILFSSGVEGVVPRLADFNNDGHLDLLLLTPNGLSVALGQPDGTLGAPIPLDLPVPASISSDGNVDIGDINGDGNLDFVLSYAGNTSGYFVGLGDGKGGFNVTFTPYGSAVAQVLLSDFNGDGKLDLAVLDGLATSYIGATPSLITVLQGNGDGTFDIANAKTALSTWKITGMQIGDYNADGKQDLTLLSLGDVTTPGQSPDPSTVGIVLLQGNGDFSFGQPVLIAPGAEVTDVQYADLNGDGLPELIATVFQTLAGPTQYFGLSILPGAGNGTFGEPINVLEPPSGPFAAASLVGDFNGDGLPDLLAKGPGLGFVSTVYVNQGGSSVALTAASATVAQGGTAQLQAVVRVPKGSPAPTGSVTFASGGTQLGSVTLSGGNTVEFAASGLPAGTNTITAAYSGDSNHEAATSAALSLVVQPLAPSFSLTATPQTINVTSGQAGSLTLNFATNPTFNGTITSTCSGLPTGATCTFNPAAGLSLTGGQTGSVQVSIATATGATAMNRRSVHPWGGIAGGLAIAQALLLFWPRRRKRMAGVLGTSLMMLFGMVLALSATGCGSSSNSSNGSGSGTASSAVVTITSTSTSGGAAITQTAAVSVVINQ